MKETSVSESSESQPISSSSSEPSSLSMKSNPSSEAKLNINEEEFYALLNSQQSILVEKYSQNQEELEKKEINELFSDIFKDFYTAQLKLQAFNIQKLDNNINKDNIINNNIIEEEDANNKNDKEMNEIIDALLTEIFFGEPFDKYSNRFYSLIKNLSKEYLTQNILEEKKNVTFIEYMEKEIFKTKLPSFVKNLLVMIITDKDKKEKERHLMEPEEKKMHDEAIRRNERKEENVKIEDWNLEKVIDMLDTPKEKD